ncbi:hypothetical protein BHE74_00011906, partial [Ensete ventricosum]
MSLAPETQHPPPAKKIESHHPKRGKMKEANRRRSQKPTNTHLQSLTSSDIMNRMMLPVVRRPLFQNDLARRQSVTVKPRLDEVPSLRRLLAAEGMRAPLRSGDQGVSAAGEALVQATGGSEWCASPLDPEARQTEGARGRRENGRRDPGPEEVSDVHGGRGWGLGLVLLGSRSGKKTQTEVGGEEQERERGRRPSRREGGRGGGLAVE